MEEAINFTQYFDTQYIVKQSLVDNNKNLFAYELLFRNSKNNFFPSYINGYIAANRLLFDSLLIQGVGSIAEGALVFIHSSNLSNADYIAKILPDNDIVIEIVADTQDTQEMYQTIRELKNKNIRFALNSYDGSEKWDDILGEVEFIKLSVEKPLIRTIFKVKKLKHTYPDIKVIVKKIKNDKTFRQLKNTGCDYFQGCFFQRPEMLKLNNISPSKIIAFELMTLISGKNLNLPLVHEKISKDIGLTTRLLILANNHINNDDMRFGSIKQAMIYLGEDILKKFIMILVVSDLEGEVIPKLSILSLTRAEFISVMLSTQYEEYVDTGYLVGLISLLDIMLNTDLETLVTELNLSYECMRSLLSYQGVIGNLLLICKMIEKNKWFDVSSLSKKFCWNMDELIKTYNKASNFSHEVLGIKNQL